MRRLAWTLAVALAIGMSGAANAVTITDQDEITVDRWVAEFEGFTVTHSSPFSSGVMEVQQMWLTVTHSENRDNGSEWWLVLDEQAGEIGRLSAAHPPGVMTEDEFDVTSYVQPLQAGVLSFTFTYGFMEGKEQVANTLFVHSSKLSVTYAATDAAGRNSSAVPEPSPLLLLGGGLAGLVTCARKRKK